MDKFKNLLLMASLLASASQMPIEAQSRNRIGVPLSISKEQRAKIKAKKKMAKLSKKRNR